MTEGLFFFQKKKLFFLQHYKLCIPWRPHFLFFCTKSDLFLKFDLIYELQRTFFFWKNALFSSILQHQHSTVPFFIIFSEIDLFLKPDLFYKLQWFFFFFGKMCIFFLNLKFCTLRTVFFWSFFEKKIDVFLKPDWIYEW